MHNREARDDRIIRKIAGIIVRDRKLLLARKRGTDLFLSLGGKPAKDEDHEEALRRELAEEAGLITIHSNYFGRFDGISALESGGIVLYAYEVVVGGDPLPGSEIAEVIWIGGDYETLGIKVGSVFRDSVIPELLRRNIVDQKSFNPYFSRNANQDATIFAVIDLDGCVIFGNEPLDPCIAASIEAITRLGVKVVFATSRAPRGVRHVLPVGMWELTTIFCNGALVRSGTKELSRWPIEATASYELCQHLLREGISLQLEYGDKFSLFGRKQEFPHQLVYDCYQVNPRVEPPAFEGVLKIAVPEHAAVYDMLRLKPHLLHQLNAISHEAGFVELVAKGVDKASAVKRVVGDRRAYVIALVNDYNDFGLLTTVSSAVVVGNRLWPARNLCRTIFIPPRVDQISSEIMRIASTL